jgi:hypothetical protein
MKLDRNKNTDIHNRTKLNNLIKDMKLLEESWFERMGRSPLSTLFSIDQVDDMLEDPIKCRKFENILSFEGIGLMTQPILYVHEEG